MDLFFSKKMFFDSSIPNNDDNKNTIFFHGNYDYCSAGLFIYFILFNYTHVLYVCTLFFFHEQELILVCLILTKYLELCSAYSVILSIVIAFESIKARSCKLGC